MTDFLCPYCPEVRPSRSRMSVHLSYQHPNVKAPAALRTVEDVSITAPELADAPTDPFSPVASVAARLEVVAEEMAALRADMDAVDARMAALDAQPVAPAVVRRRTLDQVWVDLALEGHAGAAATVMRMICEGDPDA